MLVTAVSLGPEPSPWMRELCVFIIAAKMSLKWKSVEKIA
jgi:hypothetical protein